MTKYMLLLYANETAGEAISDEDMAMWMQKMGEYADALRKADALVSNGGLGRTRNARTVHTNKDELQVHNGPYADTQEQLGGYYLIEARDLNDALQVAQKIPSVRTGSIEVRPIQEYS